MMIIRYTVLHGYNGFCDQYTYTFLCSVRTSELAFLPNDLIVRLKPGTKTDIYIITTPTKKSLTKSILCSSSRLNMKNNGMGKHHLSPM